VFDESAQVLEQELVVTPGPNPEIVVRLPAPKPR